MRFTIVALLLAISGAFVPVSAANITSLQVLRGYPNDEGIWATNFDAIIGVTDVGAPDNPFLNSSLGTGIPNGTYLLFLGFEDYWTGTAHPATNVRLVVGYDDSTTAWAEFNIGSWTTLSSWERTSGDPSLFLGGSGITGTDRVGGPNNTLDDPNRVSDIVLQFSGAGKSGSVPEPASLGLMAAALGLGFLWKRRR